MIIVNVVTAGLSIWWLLQSGQKSQQTAQQQPTTPVVYTYASLDMLFSLLPIMMMFMMMFSMMSTMTTTMVAVM